MNTCIHCDQEILIPYFSPKKAEGPFCCQGCLTVYNVINQKGLSEYYEIKKNIDALKKRAPVELRDHTYSYLDDSEFLNEYSYKNFHQLQTMEFYLEGIHCLACLWIIEKMPAFVNGVVSSKLNMGRSVVTVTIGERGKFSEVARELDSIGYRPHPLKMNQEASMLKQKEERSMLLKIGIAGAAAGNIMLYAVSLYAGASAEYEGLFNLLTVLFALPVLTYCSWPFYRTSYLALKNKSLSIDVPISLALIMGGVMGIYNLINGVHENYFDSLTALVFLLLLSRYFLKTIQEKGLSTSDLHFFYQSESVLRQDDQNLHQFVEVHPKFIRVDDILKVLPNHIIPADGVVLSGEAYLNNSLLTGESQLQKTKIDDDVFSGTMNVSGEFIMKVKKINTETRLGKILKSVENGWGQKASIVDITNLISKYFVAAVFFFAILLFFYEAQNGSLKTALEKALTLLIVTCPCALAIATPLTFIRTLSHSVQKGIVIKDDSVIEKLAKAKNLFIDKTGTITENRMKVLSFDVLRTPQLPIEGIICSLEQYSAHPVAKCLMEHFKNSSPSALVVIDLKETPGLGVSGSIDGQFYEIKNYSLFENHEQIASFKVSDTLRADARDSILKLRDLKLNLKVLSGDKREHVEDMAKNLGLKNHEYSAELSPEEKSDLIQNATHSVMIGDGANDAIALSRADTGIAVFGAMDISLRAADVYLNFPGLSSVSDLIIISRETMKVIYRNLLLSLLYNSVSVILAFTGYISPLTAAIIMPLSSLTVLISTLIGTKKLRLLWK